jgi:hypothetical protein
MQMVNDNPSVTTEVERDRLDVALDYYLIALSVLMMLLGLREWAIILGIFPGATGSFEAMAAPWKVATMYQSVIDLVASVGLWMRVPWGKVVWLLAALSGIALHTVFIRTYGSDLPIVLLHVLTIAAFVGLTLLARRA